MSTYIKKLITLGLFGFSTLTLAAGMVPQSTLIVIEESDGEGVVDIKNTDDFPNLLVTKIENIPEDAEELITVFPPVTRVEGKDTQTVRFLITTDKPIKTERLKRVIFEGVPPKNSEIDKEINVTFKQNLPVIIRPTGLAKNNTPWTGLKWLNTPNGIVVSNPTPYVVRFISSDVQLLSSNSHLRLPKSYILPNDSILLNQSGDVKGATGVRFYPATPWGFATGKPYDATLVHSN